MWYDLVWNSYIQPIPGRTKDLAGVWGGGLLQSFRAVIGIGSRTLAQAIVEWACVFRELLDTRARANSCTHNSQSASLSILRYYLHT